jgi:hypothetical protein
VGSITKRTDEPGSSVSAILDVLKSPDRVILPEDEFTMYEALPDSSRIGVGSVNVIPAALATNNCSTAKCRAFRVALALKMTGLGNPVVKNIIYFPLFYE